MDNKISLQNILSYIEGNIRNIRNKLDFQPQHVKEQIAYRRIVCKDSCATKNKCEYCGCDFEGKTAVRASCNGGNKFPDLMGKKEWDQFKIDNGIE